MADMRYGNNDEDRILVRRDPEVYGARVFANGPITGRASPTCIPADCLIVFSSSSGGGATSSNLIPSYQSRLAVQTLLLIDT